MCVGEGASVCGEEYKKEGEEIVLFSVVMCVVNRSKRVTERSIRCSLPPIPPRARLYGLPLTTTRELFTGHRQLGRWSGLGRAAGGGACKLKL